MIGLVALWLSAAPVLDPPAVAASSAEVELLLESVLPAQRSAMQVAVHGLATLPLYRVVARLNPQARTFAGEEQLRIPVLEATSSLSFRLFNNASYLGAPRIRVSKVGCPAGPCHLVPSTEPTLFDVAFDPPLPAHTVAAVDLSFEGEVPALPASASNPSAGLQGSLGMVKNHGGSATDHGAFGEGDGVLALTGMFPQLAAHFGGRPDLAAPSGIGDIASYDTANYLLTLEVPADTQVVAGGVRLGEEATPTGGKRFTYAAAAVRDFPIYAANRWKVTSEKSGAVTVSAYTLQGDEGSGKVVLGVATRALAEFSRRFGAYPWAQFSVVEQPLTGGAGGIEYPTVVGVASMLYRTGQMDGLGALFGPRSKLGSHASNVGLSDKLLEFAVAHEVAHQWWSSLVGSDPHLHPAVDEALAQYSAALYVESKRGKAAASEALEMQVAMSFQMMRQSGDADGPVNRPTDGFASPLQYAGLVYGKAPLFYRAARKQLGDKPFDVALRRYADAHRFGEAGPDDFLLAAMVSAPTQQRALERLHARWFEESHGDEDVGQMDLGKVIESVTGMKMSAEERAMMQTLMPQMMQMLQSGGLDPSMLGGP